MTSQQKSFFEKHMVWIIPTLAIMISAAIQFGVQMERQKTTDEILAKLNSDMNKHERVDILHRDANYTDLWRLADEMNTRWNTNIKIQSSKADEQTR